MTSLLNPVVLRITLRATLGRKRALVFVLVPLVLLLITVALKLVAVSPVWPAEFLGVFGFSVVLPLTALVIGTSVLGAEIDDGSIVHLLATPIRRSAVIMTKFVIGTLLTMLFVAIPELIAGLIATSGDKLQAGQLVTIGGGGRIIAVGGGSHLALGLFAGA